MTAVLLAQASAHAIPLADESVQCVVTSPPYWGLRSYDGEQMFVWGGDDGCEHQWGSIGPAHHPGQVEQTKTAEAAGRGQNAGSGRFCECGAWFGALGLEPTPELYAEHMVAVFREVWRVLRPDGTLWLNLGDSYAAQRGGTHQPAETLAGGRRGKTVNGERVNRGRHDGYSAARNASAIGLKHKDLVGIPWRVAFALQADGWYLRSDIIWGKPNPMPESVDDRPTKAHEYIFLLTKSGAPTWWQHRDGRAVRWPEARPSPDLRWIDKETGSEVGTEPPDWTTAMFTRNGEEVRKWRRINLWRAKDYYYDADAIREQATQPDRIRADTVGGASHVERQQHSEGGLFNGSSTRNARTVWEVATQPYPGAHFATFPEAIPDRCIRAGSRRGDIVLDPFNGSGTSGRVAARLGRSYIGLDLARRYLIELGRDRLYRRNQIELPLSDGGD